MFNCVIMCGILASALGDGARIAQAADQEGVPPYLKIVSPAVKPATARAVAEQNILALDTGMLSIYQNALDKYKRNIRDEVPIILALFSETGGRWILYRPGREPLEAPPVPIVYALAKSVSHSSMAIYQIVAPYLSNPADPSWHAPMAAYRSQMKSALAGLDHLELTSEDREVLGAILTNNVAFMDRCLEKHTFTLDDLNAFTRAFGPYVHRSIAIAANAQVGHWMSVMDGWKKLLGDDWEKTYAATNSLYVTRQNNIMFTILAQYMGKKTFNSRLLLLETTSFTTTPDQMLDLLSRIISDRALGKVFFRDYYLMDFELVGSGARKAVALEVAKRSMEPVLPPLAPFNSTAWPWRTDPKSGQGPATLEDVK
ncbi:MAG: hypothetical protein ABS79_04040 [Planctomycetes bacterium SCN 63-9]|nr:MAG: hypothetical protein ABS79_04040 [Planctomycetes bacterium SCN 63-9]